MANTTMTIMARLNKGLHAQHNGQFRLGLAVFLGA
jgi:hypothetical protein